MSHPVCMGQLSARARNRGTRLTTKRWESGACNMRDGSIGGAEKDARLIFSRHLSNSACIQGMHRL